MNHYVMSSDYVDVHGRSLNVLTKSDGTVYVPFHEIRKTGFHIFPKSSFVKSVVTKKLIMEEFRLYLLGAAREFLAQRDISIVNHEDIQKTIEDCHDELINITQRQTNTPIQETNKTPSGVLGRTLLVNPVEVGKTNNTRTQAAPHSSNRTENFGGFNQNNRRYNPRHNMNDSLRLPHHQNDYPKQTNLDTDDHNRRLPNTKNAAMNRHQNNYSNQNEQNRYNQNEQNRYSQNNGKISPRRNSDSKSSESEDNGQPHIKLANLNLKRVELKKEVQDVKVVHKEVINEKIKYWVQLFENEKIVLDIIEKCYELSDDATVVGPKMNEMYLAQNKDDELWYRVIVFKVNPVIKVHFVDFGNDAVVSELRQLPDELKSIPAQAVRMVLTNSGTQTPLELEEVLSVQYIKQFEDATYVVSRTNKKPTQPHKPLEPVFINKIKYSTVLVNKDVVKIISHSEGKLFLRNKEHHEKLVEVDIEIKNFTRELVNSAVPNQLVLCKKEGSEEKLCRAIVRKVENNLATVHFMDYHMDDEVPINNLYGANKTIANLPATLLESPVLKGFNSTKFDDNAVSLLDEMIMNNVKFNVAIGDSEFDLFIKDKSLSEMLFPVIHKTLPTTPPQSNKVVKTTSPADNVHKSEEKYIKVMYEDMLTYEPPMGKGDYMLTNFKDCNDFTVTSTEDKESDMLSRCTCIDVTDPEPYEPEDSEMCLGFYEGGWYRALVLDISESGVYQILFVEYGNIVEITKKDIRRFPKELKNIPILGLSCQMQVKNEEEVKTRLEKLLEPDSIFEINFLSYSVDNLQYTVEIPKIKKILEQEGLM